MTDPLDPMDIHLEDQLDGMTLSRAQRLAMFYRELRTQGVPRWAAGVLTIVDLVGYYLLTPMDDE